MTKQTKTVKWSETSHYFVVTISILTAITLTPIFIKLAKAYPKHSKAIKANIYPVIELVTIMTRSINSSLIATDLIFQFSQTCVNPEMNGCSRCNISAYLNRMLLTTSVMVRILMFLQALQINFQEFPLLAYPRGFILGAKIFYMFVWIARIALGIFKYPLNPSVLSLASNESIHICVSASDPKSKSDASKIVAIFSPFSTISYILTCILFIIKAVKLYTFTKSNITSTDPQKIMQQLRSLKSIAKTMIRHTILVLCITASFLSFLVIPRLVKFRAISLDVLDGLVASLCIFMMYPFGARLFNLIFGCFSSRVLKIWMKHEFKSTYDRNVSVASSISDSKGHKSLTDQMASVNKSSSPHNTANSKDKIILQFAADDKVKNKKGMPELSMIVEESRITSTNTITGRAPDFSEWESAELPPQSMFEDPESSLKL